MKRCLMFLALSTCLFVIQRPAYASQREISCEQAVVNTLDTIDEHGVQMTDEEIDDAMRAMMPSAVHRCCQRIGAYILFKYFDFCDCCEHHWACVKELLRRKKQEDGGQD